MIKRNLQTIAAVAASTPFSEGQLRWWVFTATSAVWIVRMPSYASVGGSTSTSTGSTTGSSSRTSARCSPVRTALASNPRAAEQQEQPT